jgi:aminopeptidase N
LLHLSFATFWDRNQDEQTLEVFRAHEVAHQWWGNGVSFRTYRDQWLDEGLADYSALLYLRNVRMNDDKFEDILDDYRKEIRKRAREAGPIDLGRRTATSENPDDYSTIVYKKGAWVVHMLRGLFTEPGTNDDEAFISMMGDFYSSHRGGLVSTDDLQTVVEQHLGSGMDWFFDQWVRGTALPTYEFAHRAEAVPDGGFEVHLRVVQRDVPESFLMIVPLAIELDDGSTQWFRIMVRDGVTEGVVPVGSEPKKVTFNAGLGVLAEVKNVKW